MLKTAIIFRDGLVLQRDKVIAIWGTSDPGASVSITMQGATAQSVSNEKGEWCIHCGPFHTSFREELIVRSGDVQICIRDVAVGEVWLAGGQSNMEFPMRYDEGLEIERTACDGRIRFFEFPKVSYAGQIDERDYFRHYGIWRICSADQIERFSAVAYYFAKHLLGKYDMPIGVIGCNWGGTPACAWMPEEAVRDCGGGVWLEDYESAIAALDGEKYVRDYKGNPLNYKIDLFADPMSDILQIGYSSETIVEKVTALGLEDELNPVMGPYSERRPAGLYHTMLKQVAPYGIRGVLWYQGEADDEKAYVYHRIFPALIRCWRELWKEELPFLFVQLAPFGSWLACRGTRYPEVRAAQQWTADNVSKTAMAVITDCGSEWDIHPKRKKPVGERLALLAERDVYGEEDIVCEAPRLRNVAVEEGRIDLKFDFAGDGLHLYGDRLNALEIFQGGYPVQCDTCEASGDTVCVSGSQIHANLPTEVRLAWTDYYEVNLKNSAGIPARPAILRA